MTNPACKNCDRQYHCKMYADARAFYADVAEFGCKHFKPKQTKTNADRIRAMTDEELAEFISGVEAEAIRRTGLLITVGDIQRGKEGWLDWLKAEVEE